ncbi:MAG: hypothetical protein KFB97_01815 [Cyanobium sp. M30B3]|jgi:hypothetical protein|nr:MAG: hypothetical protein KFB97_01815 [Cyanobium sp. M30B3]
MLTTVRRRWCRWRGWAGAAALALLPAGALAEPPSRPPGLVVLEERPSQDGVRVLGVYGPRQDPASPELWRVSFWQQRGAEVTVRTDTVRCSASAPMRLTNESGRWQLVELNPGGTIHPGNRVHHLVWWAVCHPEQAGRDPAQLMGLARQLGYSGSLRESVQILPGRGS